jgi:esterase/lipase
VDLEAFGNNSYTKQLYEVDCVVNWVCDENNIHYKAIDKNDICLIGHSMGGGIATLYAAKDARIKKLITWAGISECKTPWTNWSEEKIQAWKRSGVEYYLNGRTKQNMPLYYQLYQDYLDNAAALNIETAMRSLTITVLICHGSLDTAVPIEKAHDLHNWQPSSILFTVDSDHVFGRTHPWNLPELPEAMQAVVSETIRFMEI